LTRAATAIWRIVGQPGFLFLTFDDGPDLEWTPRVLDVLAEAGAAATFFCVGSRSRSAGGLLRRMLRGGHSVGNHTYTHRHPWVLSAHAARGEVRDGSAAIADVTGVQPAFFRPPYGRLRRCMAAEASALGQSVVLWNKSARDFWPLGGASRIAGRLQGLQGGDIVLMHDGRGQRNCPAALLQVLPGVLRSAASRSLASAALVPTCTVPANASMP